MSLRAGACPVGPCVSVSEIAGSWNIIGSVVFGTFDPWPYSNRNIEITAAPDHVYGYDDETLIEDSAISLTCTALVADPGIWPEFGTFRPAGSYGTACVEYYESGVDPELFGFECGIPCMVIRSSSFSSDPVFFVYEPRLGPVPTAPSTWATVKALFER